MADKTHPKSPEKSRDNPQEQIPSVEQQRAIETQQRSEIPKLVEAKLAVDKEIRNQLAALRQKIEQPEGMRQERSAV